MEADFSIHRHTATDGVVIEGKMSPTMGQSIFDAIAEFEGVPEVDIHITAEAPPAEPARIDGETETQRTQRKVSYDLRGLEGQRVRFEIKRREA